MSNSSLSSIEQKNGILNFHFNILKFIMSGSSTAASVDAILDSDSSTVDVAIQVSV